MRKALVAAAAAVAVAAAAAGGAAACDLELGQEYPDPAAEAAALASMKSTVDAFQTKSRSEEGEAHRFFHAKSHGCARGVLQVSGDIPADLRQGVFRTPGAQYEAVARFSNGMSDINADAVPDFRAMAVQLLGVQGDRIVTGDHSNVQTFIGSSNPIFFQPDSTKLAEQMKVFAQTGVSGAAAKAAFLARNPRAAHAIAKSLLTGAKVRNPAGATYWSQTPFRWGLDTRVAVKYKFEPCLGVAPPSVGIFNRNYLREAFDTMLNDQEVDACWNMYVQRQEDACEQPIEDSIVEWTTPWRRVGVLRLHKEQDLDSAHARVHCEDSFFTPYHGIKEHTPLGINRIRQGIYEFSSKSRHGLNGQPVYQFQPE